MTSPSSKTSTKETEAMSALTVTLPAPDDTRWTDGDVSRFVGARLYLDLGDFTYVGKVAFARGAVDRDDDTQTASHVEVRVDKPAWCVSSPPETGSA